MKRKILAITILSAMLIMMLTGCSGGASLDRPAMETGAKAVEVTGSCQAVYSDSVLTVSGECNLVDGIYGTISVYSYEGKELELAKVIKQGDNLTAEFAVQDDWTDRVYGFITFDNYQAGTQPTAITDLYGSKFENLTGENTLWDSHGVAAVFQSEMIEIS